MTIAPWAYYTILAVLAASSITNIILALALRSARKQMEVDAMCNL